MAQFFGLLMKILPAWIFSLLLCIPATAFAEEQKPVELEALKAHIGVWDAEIKVWASGPDADPLTFKGVETIRAYGEYWIVSDFDSEMNGQTMRVHSVIGYDLDKGKLVGTQVDHGPYAATLTGAYNKEKKAVQWMIDGKDLMGNAMSQDAVAKLESEDVRTLEMHVPGAYGKKVKYMHIRYVKRK